MTLKTSQLREIISAPSRTLVDEAGTEGAVDSTEKLLDAFDAEPLRLAERGTIAVGPNLPSLAQQLATLAEAGLTLDVAADGKPANPEETAGRLLGLRHCSRTARQLLRES
jgi:hypothetical protein